MRSTTRTAIGGVVTALVIGTAALPARATPAPDAAATTNQMVARTRAAVAKLHDVDAAIAAGYVQVGECAESPAGAMGVHFMNPSLITPGIVDASRPPFLTYGPSRDGGLELWSAEFFEPDVGQPTPRFGTQAFDGPMPGHEPGMPTHYDLHVWVGAHNPAGLFAAWNPRLHC